MTVLVIMLFAEDERRGLGTPAVDDQRMVEMLTTANRWARISLKVKDVDIITTIQPWCFNQYLLVKSFMH